MPADQRDFDDGGASAADAALVPAYSPPGDPLQQLLPPGPRYSGTISQLLKPRDVVILVIEQPAGASDGPRGMRPRDQLELPCRPLSSPSTNTRKYQPLLPF